MVTPENGVIILKGKSGRFYNLNLYSSDVLGAAVTLNFNGLAGTNSTTFFNTPEDCVIVDVSVATGQTVATNWVVQVNDQNVGVISIANQINTLATRGAPNIFLQGNKKLTLIQA
jgi:hypothetical protein